MAKKMLIDATHAEETRVVVADGNKVEEFDFESLNKRQLAGNIYLAKVTRVEPSLQAAFVDYGGNRHGFLAFSEIHPDYYQIPTADREALLAEEQARAQAERMRAVQQDVAPGVASMLRRARDQIRPRRLESEAARAAPATADARAALSTALEAVERGDTDTAMRAMAEAQDALSAARDGAAKPASGEGEGPASVAQRGRDADRFDAALDRVRRASPLARRASRTNRTSSAADTNGTVTPSAPSLAIRQYISRAALDHLRKADNRIQRRLHLMAYGRHKVIFHSVDAFQLHDDSLSLTSVADCSL